MRPATSRAGLPAPEQAPPQSMPAHDRIGCHDRQVLAPAATEPTSHDPEQLVPGTKASTWSGSSRPSKDGQLVAQEQVLEHEVLTRGRTQASTAVSISQSSSSMPQDR
jgi:hypothetical protein